jgi:hypothetical protein
MADLDFSGSAEPIASTSAPDFSQHAEPVRNVSAAENIGRGFISGGGDLLNLISGVQHAVNPADAIAQKLMTQDALNRGLPAEQIKAVLDPASSLAENAHDFGNLSPTETTDLSGKIAGGVGRAIPSIAAALGTGGGASLAEAVPASVRAVPYLGRLAGALAGGAPTATVLTAEQAANLPDNMSDADKVAAIAKAGGLNLALAGLPAALGSTAVTRALTGGALGYGTSVASSALQGQPQDQANNIVGALFGAALGQHPTAPQVDPHLARYQASVDTPFTPAARPELPAPEANAASTEAPVQDQTVQTPVERSASTAPSPAQAEAVFRSDPRVALAALDHPTLVQVAQDAGFTVKPGEDRTSIIGKMVSSGDYLHSDVLPEYVAAVSKPTESTPNNSEIIPTSPEVVPEFPPQAQMIPSGAPVSVDTSGTAYTPAQGSDLIQQALSQGVTSRPALPEPRTIVDSQGNAVDSNAFTRQLQDQRQALESETQEQVERRNLGITPDIERTQAPTWAKNQAESTANAQRLADQQAMQDARDAANSDVVGQRQDDAPQWWLAGQHSADEAAPDLQARQDAREAENGELAQQRSVDMPEEPAWWQEGQHQEALQEMARQRAAMPEDAKSHATEQLQSIGIDPADHEEALATSQLLDRAYDAGASVEDVRHVLDAPSSDEAAQGLRDLTDQLEASHGTEQEQPDEAQSTGNQASNPGRAGIGPSTSASSSEREPIQSASGTIPSRASGRGRVEEGVSQPDGSSQRQIVPESERRDDWSAPTEGRAITALDELVKRYGGSTLADSIRDDLRETTTAQLIGQKVQSHEDLAALASVYRNPSFETMRYVYVNKAGIVLGETAVSSRMPSSAVAFPTDATDGVDWIVQNAPEGATGLWMIHNHPSGNPKPSEQDLDYTGSMGIKLGDRAGAPKLRGHVVLDHDTFGNIDALGDFRGIGKVPGKERTADPLRSHRGDLSMFDTPVTSPAFAATTGKKIAAATPENSSAVVIMDAQGRVASIHTFPNDFLTTPRGAAMVSRLGGKRGAVGIGIVTSAENFAKNRSAFDKATERGLLRDATIVGPDGHALSLGGTPLFPQAKRSNFGKHSAGARARSEFGQQVREEPSDKPMISLSAVRRALADRGMTPEAIAAMSPSDLRAEQANLRARSEPTPELKQTGVKNATKEEERGMKGKAAVEHDLASSNPEQYAVAKERLDRDPHAGQDLAQKVIKEQKPITAEETILLSLDAMRIINQRQQAYEVAEKALEGGDTTTYLAALERTRTLDDQMEANDVAARYSGTLAGQALQARKVMIQQDYSMARLMLRGKVSAGRPLKPEERSALEARAAEIEKRSAELDKREAALRAQETVAKPIAQKRAAKAKFDDLVAQLKKISEKDQLKPGCVV